MMAGAYVAKPEVIIPPVIPPGWNPVWPYPGPFPPGFDPNTYNFPGEGEPSNKGTPDDVKVVVVTKNLPVTTEDGQTTVVGVFLRGHNASPITVPVYPDRTSEFILDTWDRIGVVEFQSGETEVMKSIVVTGKNDGIIDGDKIVSIVAGPSASSDPDYCNLSSDSVFVTNKEIIKKVIYVITITSKFVAYTDNDGKICEDIMHVEGILGGDIIESGSHTFLHSIGHTTTTTSHNVEIIGENEIRITKELTEDGFYTFSVNVSVGCQTNDSYVDIQCRTYFYGINQAGEEFLMGEYVQVLPHYISGNDASYTWMSLNQLDTSTNKLTILHDNIVGTMTDCDCCCTSPEPQGEYVVVATGVVIESEGESGWLNATGFHYYRNMVLDGDGVSPNPPAPLDGMLEESYSAWLELKNGETWESAQTGYSIACGVKTGDIGTAQWPIGFWDTAGSGWVGQEWRYGYTHNYTVDNCSACTDEPLSVCQQGGGGGGG